MCTALHDAVGQVLTGTVDVSLPAIAVDILAPYAKEHMGDLVRSDVYVQALVAIHHMLYILPGLGDRSSPSATAESIWSGTGQLSLEERQILVDKIDQNLSELIGQISCRAE